MILLAQQVLTYCKYQIWIFLLHGSYVWMLFMSTYS